MLHVVPGGSIEAARSAAAAAAAAAANSVSQWVSLIFGTGPASRKCVFILVIL